WKRPTRAHGLLPLPPPPQIDCIASSKSLNHLPEGASLPNAPLPILLCRGLTTAEAYNLSRDQGPRAQARSPTSPAPSPNDRRPENETGPINPKQPGPPRPDRHRAIRRRRRVGRGVEE